MGDFKLLEHLRASGEGLKDPEALSLSDLKTKTKEFRELHTKITEQIWSLNLQMIKLTGDALLQLKKERDELKKLFSECNSQGAIIELLKIIKEKEGIESDDDNSEVCSPVAF